MLIGLALYVDPAKKIGSRTRVHFFGSDWVNELVADEDWYANEMGFSMPDVKSHLREHSSDGLSGISD